MHNLGVVFAAQGKVTVEDFPIPKPGPDEVLIHSLKSICSVGTESICLHGKFEPGNHWDAWVGYPMRPGYSLVGRVEAAGEQVTGVRSGDLVAARANHIEWPVRPAREVYRVPAGVSPEAAAWHGIGKIVQVGVRRAQHTLGDSVVIIGLGTLGQLLVQYLKLQGVRQLIAVDTSAFRLELARRFGATHCLEAPVQEVREQVWEITGGRGADVVYDVTGAWAVLEAALRLPRKLGKVILLGDTGFPSKQRLTGDLITRGLSILGAHDTLPPFEPTDRDHWSHANIEALFLEYLARGELDPEPLITHVFSPLEAPQAYQLMEEKRDTMLGVMFDWERLSS